MTCLNIKVSSHDLYAPPPPPKRPPLNAPLWVNAHPPLEGFPNLNALGVNPREYGIYIFFLGKKIYIHGHLISRI